MNYYYVTHPNWSFSAVIEAPTTEKARTAFLDYLERNGHIYRGDRQSWRKDMVAERLEDPAGVSADLRLSYDLEEGPAPVVQIGYSGTPRELLDLSGGEMVEVPIEEPPELPEVYEYEPERKQRTPLEDVALGGFS